MQDRNRDEEIRRDRAEIASMIAHEVRGPVATIKGLAATVLANDERLPPDDRRELIGLIAMEADRLLTVVDQTSLALKIDAGGLSLVLRYEELGPIVAEAVAGASLGDRPVELDVAERIVAPVDRRWFAEALTQGLTNAARYSPEGTPIVVRLRSAEGGAVVEIEDRGPGIPPEQREEVFRRFATWRPPGYEDRPGTGLGLFISRALLAEHGGEASIGEASEGGTMLRLRLPTEGEGDDARARVPADL